MFQTKDTLIRPNWGLILPMLAIALVVLAVGMTTCHEKDVESVEPLSQ